MRIRTILFRLVANFTYEQSKSKFKVLNCKMRNFLLRIIFITVNKLRRETLSAVQMIHLLFAN